MDITEDLDGALKVLVGNADALRRAGVKHLQIGDLVVDFYATETVAPTVRIDEQHAEDPDPMLNPATFGRRTSLPGFSRPEGDE